MHARDGMVFGEGDGVPLLMEVRQTARLDTSEILHLIEKSEGVEVMERVAHNLRGTPQFGIPVNEPEPPEIVIEDPPPAVMIVMRQPSRLHDLVLGGAIMVAGFGVWLLATSLL